MLDRRSARCGGRGGARRRGGRRWSGPSRRAPAPRARRAPRRPPPRSAKPASSRRRAIRRTSGGARRSAGSPGRHGARSPSHAPSARADPRAPRPGRCPSLHGCFLIKHTPSTVTPWPPPRGLYFADIQPGNHEPPPFSSARARPLPSARRWRASSATDAPTSAELRPLLSAGEGGAHPDEAAGGASRSWRSSGWRSGARPAVSSSGGSCALSPPRARRVRFHWDCKWRALQEGWTDYFGFPDQVRAAREFGHDCFRLWEEERRPERGRTPETRRSATAFQPARLDLALAQRRSGRTRWCRARRSTSAPLTPSASISSMRACCPVRWSAKITPISRSSCPPPA